MEEQKDTQFLLEQLVASGHRREKYARLQCIFSAVAAVCCACVLVIALIALPKLQGMAAQAETVLGNVEQVTQQLALADWAGVMADLETVTEEMAQADLGGLAEDVSALVTSSQVGLEAALGKLDAIDLETLNKAIRDLAAVVQPLANFFGKF